MKRIALLSTFLVLAGSSFAQPFPFELESHRKPAIQTKGNVLIRAGRILTATKGTLENTDILVRDGKIAQIGKNLSAPAGFQVIDARKMVVAPGLVDGHSHRASDGTNEGADSITGETRIGDVLNLGALNTWQALASGHTAAVILHGSANAVGGESVVIKYKYQRPAYEAVVKDAPRMIKFALGENVTRKSSTTRTRFPQSRMGVEAVYRRGFEDAKKYKAAWQAWESDKSKPKPRKDLRLEILKDILDRKVWVQCHSYRSDEMLMMVRLSQEFGFKIGAMQHALEAYKIAPEMAAAGVGASIFVDNWSFKQEGYDSIPWNAAICTAAGVNLSINTDGVSGTTALNIDAAKVMRFGGLTEQQALQTITINPAKQLGIDHRTGSIEVGKDADFGIWDGHPLSVYGKCAMTLVEGEVFFQRRDAFGVDGIGQNHLDIAKPAKAGDLPPLPKSRGYAITNARIHPVSKPPFTGTIVMRDGKIVALGERVQVPSGVHVINGKGMNVLPGFIDANTSLGLSEISGIAVMNDQSEMGNVQPDMDSLTNLWVESTHFGPARYNGVTNAVTAPSGGLVAGQAAVIHTDGYTTEDFGLKRKAILVVQLPGTPRPANFDMCDQIDSSILFGLGGAEGHHGHDHDHESDGDEHLTDEQRRLFFDFLGGRVPPQEFFAAQQGGGGQNTASALREISALFDKALDYEKKGGQPRDLQMEAMLPYVKGEKLVYINARNAPSIRTAVQLIQKYKLKGVIVGAAEAWRETKLLAESKIPVIINPAGRSTLSANLPEQPHDPYDTPYVVPGLLAKAGVKFAFQSGNGADVMNLPVRAAQSIAYGLKAEDALRALTLSAAEILGVDDQIGSLEPGKLGNVILVEGDPFEMTSQVRRVFIKGQPASLVTKHTQLRDKYMARVK